MAVLKVLSGEAKGKTFELKPEAKFTIGRDPDNSLSINDAKVSRHHAEIYQLNNVFFIKDLKSANGTMHNNTKITECSLKHNDHINIGDTRIVYEEKQVSAKEVVPQTAPEVSSDDYLGDSTVEIKLDLDREKTEKEAPVSVGKELSSPKLATLYQIAKVISTEKDLTSLLRRILKMLVETTKADQGYILFWDKSSDKVTARMIYPKEIKDMKVSQTIVRRVAQYTRPLLTSDAMLDARLKSSQSVMMSDIKSVICAPMISTPKGEGVLYLESNKLGWSFSQEDLEFVTTVAIQTGMAYTAFSASEKARRTLMGTIKTLVTASEIRDPKMQGHAERVAKYTASIVTELDLNKIEVYYLQFAALLHDVGKIVQPTATALSDRSADRKEHILGAEKLLKQLSDVKEIMPAIKYHHEKVDGSGFPEGLKGDKIPLKAKIIAVANVLDNLITYGGPRRQGLPIKETLTEMQNQAGVEFDQKVVSALMSAYEKGTLFNPPPSPV